LGHAFQRISRKTFKACKMFGIILICWVSFPSENLHLIPWVNKTFSGQLLLFWLECGVISAGADSMKPDMWAASSSGHWIILLFNNLDHFHGDMGSLWQYWPVILILSGIQILARRSESGILYVWR